MKNEMKSVGPYSISRWAGDLLFISGQLPINQETGELEKDFVAQCERSLANIELVLENEGLTLDDVVKLTVLMNDLEDFDEINKLFEKRFNQPYPSRSTFEVSRLPKDALVEIEAIAFKK
ncbi:RutC family protein [Jeotgalibaca dankookensis]|uniref:RutC family protein n=1 Tax=Jeotgalibaca dankookensis TaxID=708126 RepID=A0A1S6IR00_9LACT|nr:Rid family detoxifying hydrolase [Jeotgalibaca dankookensis]AQS53975.1 RutC family protein [Jeotgalibaca dankookensis]